MRTKKKTGTQHNENEENVPGINVNFWGPQEAQEVDIGMGGELWCFPNAEFTEPWKQHLALCWAHVGAIQQFLTTKEDHCKPGTTNRAAGTQWFTHTATPH